MTPVLYYHRVGPFRPGAPRKMTVLPGKFRAQMHFLRRNRIRVLTLDEVLGGLPGVALTFDDGFKDVMEHAVPVLRSLGFPATFFIVTGVVGGTDEWMRVTAHPEERIVDWDDVRALLDAGMTVGSHSVTHGKLTRKEIVASRQVLRERLGIPIDHFAYPRGENTPESVAWVRDAGYRAGWATKSGDGDAFTRRRLPISASATIYDFGKKLLKARFGVR